MHVSTTALPDIAGKAEDSAQARDGREQGVGDNGRRSARRAGSSGSERATADGTRSGRVPIWAHEGNTSKSGCDASTRLTHVHRRR